MTAKLTANNWQLPSKNRWNKNASNHMIWPVLKGQFTEAYLEFRQTPKMKCLPNKVKGWKLWTIFEKHSILDVWLDYQVHRIQDFKYAWNWVIEWLWYPFNHRKLYESWINTWLWYQFINRKSLKKGL